MTNLQEKPCCECGIPVSARAAVVSPIGDTWCPVCWDDMWARLAAEDAYYAEQRSRPPAVPVDEKCVGGWALEDDYDPFAEAA